MNPKWAEENLQTIRTLMERSAIYRRALAPIMTLIGVVGIIGGLAGWGLHIKSNLAFLSLWIGVALISTIGALLLIRRQALKDSEVFWSSPTRRVAQALLPPFFIGFTFAVFAIIASLSGPAEEYDEVVPKILILAWTWVYGCAIHAAGFFMPRGVRWLGWVFVFTGVFLALLQTITKGRLLETSPHLLMAAIFGGLHLAYGIYLYFTEKKSPTA